MSFSNQVMYIQSDEASFVAHGNKTCVGVDDARTYLQVFNKNEDAFILGLIQAAEQYVQKASGYIFTDGQITEYWNDNIRYFRLKHVAQDPVITVYDNDENAIVLNNDQFTLEREYIRITDENVSIGSSRVNNVEITYNAKAIDFVPQQLKQAILYITFDMYFKRGDTIKNLPSQVSRLINSIKANKGRL